MQQVEAVELRHNVRTFIYICRKIAMKFSGEAQLSFFG